MAKDIPTQKNRIMAVNTPLGEDKLLLTGFTGQDGLSQLFCFNLDMVAENRTAVPFDQLLGKPVSVRLNLPEGKRRLFHGICKSFAQGESDGDFTEYVMEMVPALWLATLRTQSRIFQGKNVPDIIKEVLQGLDVSFNIQGTFEQRNYCVQYRETDFNFVSRLMEEEGIYYFFKHSEAGHQMVIANSPGSHLDLPTRSTIFYQNLSLGTVVADEDVIFDWTKSQNLIPGKYTLFDHSFGLPHKKLEATRDVTDSVPIGQVTHPIKLGANGSLEMFDWPGDYAHRFDPINRNGGEQPAELAKVFVDNKRTVKIRMEQATAGSLVVQGASNCRQLVSGHKFTLNTRPGDQTAKQSKAEGSYVLTRVTHYARSADFRSGGNTTLEYHNSFTCIPAGLPFSPPRVTPKPIIPGTQSAVVVGPPGQEIFTDKFSRVKVQFHWDRQGTNDANSSCWIRVATHWAGKQWGIIHIPRVGQEVLVDFLEGDPDTPVIVGSVYNDDQMPPYKLPENATQSGIKSRSSLKGTPENFNEIRFEDLKDKEQIIIHAERDLNSTVERNETRSVGADRSTTIGHDDTLKIGNNHVIAVGAEKASDGSKTETIKKDSTLTIKEGNYKIDVQTGELNEHVKGAVEQNYDDIWQATAKQGIRLESQKAGVFLFAAEEIKLKVGACSLEMKKDGTITLTGVKISITGSGSVTSVAGGENTVTGSKVNIN